MENSKPNNADETAGNKPQPDGADQADILQHEKLIDPGNEHSHHVDDEIKPGENKETGLDAKAGDDKAEPATNPE